jgi:HEAT repeat protein
LGQIGDKKAVEPLIKALQGNRPDLKAAAAVALGEMGDPRAVEPLIKEFRSRKKSWGGTATAIALGRIGDKRAIGPLTEALADEEAYVREAAATALDNIGVEPKGLQDRLTYLIASGNREELIKIGQPAVKPLMESLAFHDWKGCILAADVLGQIGDPAAVEPLIKVLEHENSNVRAAAAKALIEIPDRRAMQPLERTLGDWDAGPNAAAALEALGWKPKTDEQRIIFLVANRDKQGLLESWEQTRKVLLAEARSDDKKRINNAVGAFISIGKEEDVDDLINILMNYGEKEMAIMFLNCGNERLAAAAKFWAKEMGYLVLPFASRSSSVSWGR